MIKKPIIITSGYRCKKHNKDIGGVIGSQHTLNKAADIVVPGMSPIDVWRAASKITQFFEGGMGLYRTFVHLDVRGHKARWSYKL